jgi:hypothetical protein
LNRHNRRAVAALERKQMPSPLNPSLSTPAPEARITVSLTEDRHAIVLRSILSLPGYALGDSALVLPIETAEAVGRAILEQVGKASKIVIPQTPLG